MIPWPGLLKWSLKYQDGTRPTEIPKLTEEQRLWLEEALKAASVDVVKVMGDVAAEFEKTWAVADEIEANLDRLNRLEDLLSSLDMNNNFCKIGAAQSLFEIALRPDLPEELRPHLLSLLRSISANSWFVQDFFSRLGFERLIPLVRNSSDAVKLRGLSALSALICAENLTNKRIFVQNEGIELLIDILSNETNPDILSRTLTFTEHLLRAQDVLKQKGNRLPFDGVVSEIDEQFESVFAKMVEKRADLSQPILRCLQLSIQSFEEGTQSRLYIPALECAAAFLEKDKNAKIIQALVASLKIFEEKFPEEFKEPENAALLDRISKLCSN